MRFLTDAHIGHSLMDGLRQRGHDVSSARDLPPATADEDVLRLAAEEDRIVITAYTDFGELVFRYGFSVAGVILLRQNLAHEDDRTASVLARIDAILSHQPGSFIVITDAMIRPRPMPEEGSM